MGFPGLIDQQRCKTVVDDKKVQPVVVMRFNPYIGREITPTS